MNLRPDQLEFIRRCALTGARGIRNDGRECAPMLLLFNSRPDGDLGDVAAISLAGRSKDFWAAMQQRYARAPDVAAAVLIVEAWQSVVPPGADVPATTEGDPDREEVLMVNVLSDRAQWLLTAPIDGRTIHDAQLKQINTGGAERMEGRFIREATP